MSASNEGDGRDGRASPGKRKSTTPGTDTSHTQRGTSHEYEGESVASENQDDGGPPIAKRQKLEAEVDVPIPQTETSQGEIDIDQDSEKASRDETETGASKKDEARNEGKNQQTGEADDKDEKEKNEDNDEEEAPIPKPPPKPEPKLCGICKSQPGKYKCPQPGCQLAYCSVACNKIHKENHPPPPAPVPTLPSSSKLADQQPNNPIGNKQADPYEVLLHHRSEFDRLFQRYPGLERVLNKIQECTLPPPDQPSLTGGVPAAILQQTGGVSGFNPLISSKNYYGGKGSGSGGRQPQIWTGEIGLRKGAEALKKARTDPGLHGDGVREFCELVMYLLNSPSLRPATATATTTQTTSLNATSLVREEVVADQARVIQTLLEAEGGGDDL